MADYKLVVLARWGSPWGHMSVAILQDRSWAGFWGCYPDGVKSEQLSELKHYKKAAYVEISKEQAAKVQHWINIYTSPQSRWKLYWHATIFNCTHFARDMCRIAGVDTPRTNLNLPVSLINEYIKHGWKQYKL